MTIKRIFTVVVALFFLQAALASAQTITSSTYNATTGSLVVTGVSIEANAGGLDIDASTLTFTGEGDATYKLTTSAEVLTS